MQFFLFTIALALLVGAHATRTYKTQSSRTYTNIGSLDQCLQKIEAKVCDPHGVFTEDERTRLNELLERVQESTKREGYPMTTATKKCGSKGITMPIIMLKAELINAEEVQRHLNDVNKQYTDEHPCKRIAIVMMHQSDKVEHRRFWANNNWNVNVKPHEIVALYRKEIPRITKAKYADALYNIVQEFMQMATQRLQTPFEQAPMTRTYSTTTNQRKGFRGETKYTPTQNEQPEEREDTEQVEKTERIPVKSTKFSDKKTKTDKDSEEMTTGGGRGRTTVEEQRGDEKHRKTGENEYRKTEAAGSEDGKEEEAGDERKEEEKEEEELKRKQPKKQHKKPKTGGGTYAKSTATENAKEDESSD